MALKYAPLCLHAIFIYIPLLVLNVAVKLCAQAEGYFRDDPPFSHPSQHVRAHVASAGIFVERFDHEGG